jgi:hypothetical protein
MPMPLDRWHATVTPHLDMIEAGAEMCERHAKALIIRPDWETRAQVELDVCAEALRAALARVERAQAIYQAKEIDR